MLWRRAARHPVSVFDTAGFILPLNDLGAGAANLVLQRGAGVATFTRSTTAWSKLASGLWGSIAPGVARSCYLGANTIATAYGGYFAESAGTQLVTPTASIRDMTQAAWIKVTMTTAFTSTGIGGVASSCTRLTATGANSTILQTLVAAATSRTYSCWVKRITGSGTVLLKQGTATLDITALINSSTFTRVELNDNELNVAFGLQINTSGDALDVDFNQFEAGAAATSPMDAAGAVRNEDILTYPFAGNLINAQGTLYAEIALSKDSGDNRIVYEDSIGFIYDTTHVLLGDGTTVATSNTDATLLNGAVHKAAVSWNAARKIGSLSGGIGTVDANYDGSMFTTTLHIADVNFNGMLKNLRGFQTQLSDGQLQGITA